jgi:hypothetical protein
MTKAEKIKTPEEIEQEERVACANEINEILKKYQFAMIPFNQPSFKFVKVKNEEKQD